MASRKRVETVSQDLFYHAPPPLPHPSLWSGFVPVHPPPLPPPVISNNEAETGAIFGLEGQQGQGQAINHVLFSRGVSGSSCEGALLGVEGSENTTTSLFGNTPAANTGSTGSLGAPATTLNAFGGPRGGLFGNFGANPAPGGLFGGGSGTTSNSTSAAPAQFSGFGNAATSTARPFNSASATSSTPLPTLASLGVEPPEQNASGTTPGTSTLRDPSPSLPPSGEVNQPDIKPPANSASAKTKKKAADYYSANELFFLVSNANELNVYGAPYKERAQTWSRLQIAHERKSGYSRPVNSLKKKFEELVFYHMDPDSKKVPQTMRDLFMTEANQVRFGASLDPLKDAWEARKKPDSEKIKEQKKKDENRVGGAILRDAMRTTWQRNLIASCAAHPEQADEAEATESADVTLVAADDELSTGSDKDDSKENIAVIKTPIKPSRKRKRQVIDLCQSDEEAEPSLSKSSKKIRRDANKPLTPRFDWASHLKEERDSRNAFETKLMERLDEGNKYNQDAMAFMKSAHHDTCSFQNRFLDILSRKL